ncbi:unnamed protein product, partial [Amoebophrya sp. A25]
NLRSASSGTTVGGPPFPSTTVGGSSPPDRRVLKKRLLRNLYRDPIFFAFPKAENKDRMVASLAIQGLDEVGRRLEAATLLRDFDQWEKREQWKKELEGMRLERKIEEDQQSLISSFIGSHRGRGHQHRFGRARREIGSKQLHAGGGASKQTALSSLASEQTALGMTASKQIASRSGVPSKESRQLGSKQTVTSSPSKQTVLSPLKQLVVEGGAVVSPSSKQSAGYHQSSGSKQIVALQVQHHSASKQTVLSSHGAASTLHGLDQQNNYGDFHGQDVPLLGSWYDRSVLRFAASPSSAQTCFETVARVAAAVERRHSTDYVALDVTIDNTTPSTSSRSQQGGSDNPTTTASFARQHPNSL